jgi:hypothetical protein
VRLVDRFKRLTLWNKINVIGAIASIIAFLLWLFVPSLDQSHTTNVTHGAIGGDVNTGGGDVFTGDIHVQSPEGLSSASLRKLLTQERPPLSSEPDQREPPDNTGKKPFPEPQRSRRWLSTSDTPSSIIESLKGTSTFSEYRSRAESLYEDHWIPDPGWSGIVHELPERHGKDWLVTIYADGSRVFIYAITSNPSDDQWRKGQRVAVIGRIREVRYNPFIYVDNATLSPH